MAQDSVGLAATALPEFWPSSQQTLFLGSWCLTPSNEAQRGDRSSRVMTSPWNDAATAASAFNEFDAVQEALLVQLSERLGRAHDLKRSLRWWRIILGPWLMAYLTTLQDRLLYAQKAVAEAPGASVIYPDSPPMIACDTSQYVRWLPNDAMNLHFFSAALRWLNVEGSQRPSPALPDIVAGKKWRGLIGRSLISAHKNIRAIYSPTSVYSSLYMPRRDQWRLFRAGGGRLQPLLTVLPDSPAIDGLHALRQDSPSPVNGSPLAGLAARTINAHLPRLFVEGWANAWATLNNDWPRPPRAVVTCVGWQMDEPFKMLAAECVENGGRLVIAQHGGAYGMHSTLHSERHERRVADEWWSWGWSEPSTQEQPARVVPMPNPRLKHVSSSPNKDWLLVTHALPRGSYMFYYCNVPAWPRYEEYLDQRSDFVRALGDRAREDLCVRLPVDDGGWGMRARLLKAIPDLKWEEAKGSMIERARSARLTVVDHPQTSALELIAADIPTVLFWDPVLWPMRESARPWLEELKTAGVLHDTPQQAAHQIEKILVDPERWWRSADVVKAVSSFRSRFACGHQNWDHLWVRRLHQLEKEANP